MPAMLEYLALYPVKDREDSAEIPWSHPLLAEGETNADRYYVRRKFTPRRGIRRSGR